MRRPPMRSSTRARRSFRWRPGWRRKSSACRSARTCRTNMSNGYAQRCRRGPGMPAVAESAGRDPLVSVVIPIYNHAHYLPQCLDSVARQAHPRIEVIAIDDGSSDASLAVAQAWFDAHGHRFERWLLQGQPNAGITTTFNRLVAL